MHWRYSSAKAIAGRLWCPDYRTVSLKRKSVARFSTTKNDVSFLYSWKDVQYYAEEDACKNKHVLDIHIPAAPFPRPLLPVWVFFHGGAWTRGDKSKNINRRLYMNVAEALCGNGMITVLANYRLSPQVRHPEHSKDAARALTWVYQNIQKFGGDPQRMHLMGHSAGAHLLAYIMSNQQWILHQDDPREEGSGESAGGGGVPGLAAAARAVRALCLVSPPLDLPALAAHPFGPLVVGAGVFGPPPGAGGGGAAVEGGGEEEEEAWEEASPWHRCLNAAGCPLEEKDLLIFTAENDVPQFSGEADRLLALLSAREKKKSSASYFKQQVGWCREDISSPQNVMTEQKVVQRKHVIIPGTDHLSIIHLNSEELHTEIMISEIVNVTAASATSATQHYN